jgi:hypothetical protein
MLTHTPLLMFNSTEEEVIHSITHFTYTSLQHTVLMQMQLM